MKAIKVFGIIVAFVVSVSHASETMGEQMFVTGLWMRGSEPGCVQIFRRDIDCTCVTNLSLCLSADMRYVFKVDGDIVGRGPDRDMLAAWSYRKYNLPLSVGRHRLEAVVYHGGPEKYKPLAQVSYAPGFFCGGLDGWQVAAVAESEFTYGGRRGGAFGAGLPNIVRGNSPEFMDVPDGCFKPPVEVRHVTPPNDHAHRLPGWRLVETRLPPQMAKPFPLKDAPFPKTIPANAEISFDMSFGDYLTAYPILVVKGGSGGEIRCAWAETPEKADRGIVFEDTYRPTGGKGRFTTSWIRSGMMVRFTVKTDAEPLTIESLDIVESRYPMNVGGAFSCDDESLDAVWRLCRRGLEVCAHEGVWDCPFFEQLTYLGDTRVQFLAQNVLTSDDRLQKHVMERFALARDADGMMPMNVPCDGPQSLSATYTLIYPLELADYMKWHGDREWLKRQVPTLLSVMSGFRLRENADGLLQNLPGWCFVDWADWPGTAARMGCGLEAGRLSAIENLFYVLALEAAEDVCRATGEQDMADVWRVRRRRLADSVRSHFWDVGRSLIADDPEKSRFSEHVQALALQADILTDSERRTCLNALVNDADLTRVSIYFSHYLFEAFGRSGRTDLILKRLTLWRNFARAGLYTPPETTLPTRSYCHGWSGHPVYHFARHFAGIRPDGDFFSRVCISPQPADLRKIACTVPHELGQISVDLAFEDGRAKGMVSLPPRLEGVFLWQGVRHPLRSGNNAIDVLPVDFDVNKLQAERN